MANELPQIEQSLQENVSKAVEGGMPLDTPLYGARGETLGDMVVMKEPTTPAPDDPILFEGKEAAPSVDVFLGQESFTVDDILPDDVITPRSVDTRRTDKTTSAKIAALKDEAQALTTYGENVEALGEGNVSSLQDTLAKLEQTAYEQGGDAVAQALSNPDLSDEDKIKLLDDYQNFQLTDFSLNKAVMTESLIAGDGNENPQQENVRINTINAIDEVNASKREIQAMLNLEAAKSDISIGKAYKDAFVHFTPYMETTFFTKLGIKTNEDILDAIGNIGFLGEAKQELRNALIKMPPAERVEAARKLIEAINATPGALPFEQNDYSRLEALRVVAEDGFYTDFDRYADDIISMLDATFFGGVVGRTVKGAQRVLRLGRTAENVARDAKRLAVRTNVDQTSLSQLYKDTNITKAKNAHEAVIADKTGEVAEAVYGTSRVEAVANDVLPEVGSDVVRHKVGEPDSTFVQSQTPNPDVMDIVDHNGALYYWQAEKEAMRSKVVTDFENAVGVRNRKEMNQIEATDDGVKIKAVYGTPQFGYENASDALETVKVSLRGYGVTDDQLTLLGRFGDKYQPMKLSDVNALEVLEKKGVKVEKPQDFLVQVNHDYKFNPLDNPKWQEAGVRMNFFDRLPIFAGKRQGSLTRHLVDIASMMHPRITQAANVAVDKAAAVERMILTKASEYSDGMRSLKAERQDKLMDYFKEANENGIKFSPTDMKARGFFDEEIEVARKWRSTWDDIWHLENRDYAKTLSAKGYEWFIDSANDTKLIVKPIHRTKVGNTRRVYDQATGKIRDVKTEEITKLYDEGGSLVQLRTPIKVGDDEIDVAVSVNKAGSSYTRRINQSDSVLNYREGYYSRRYTAPKYVDKIVKDKRGNILHRQAVAVAGDSREAELIARQLARTNEGYEFVARGDVQREAFDAFEDEFNVLQSHGRTAQRTRGKLLQNSNMKSDFGDNYVMSPTDSMVYAARSVSNRVSMRDYIEATKTRFMKQFEDVLPKDKFGRPSYPADITHLKSPGKERSAKMADARSTYEYINYLESGYINGLDEVYKAVMNGMSEVLGKYAIKYDSKALAAMERGALASATGRGPTGLAKNISFNLYLASNPLRQFIVQGHQAVQLLAYNPIYSATKMGGDMILLFSQKLGYGKAMDDAFLKRFGHTRKSFDEMTKAWERSGLSASVDKNALINGSLSELLEEAQLKGKTGVLGKAFNVSRKIGFDIGEEINIMTSWLAHRDKLMKTSKKTGAELDDLITASARNFTYAMNRAGDMPYNQNFLGMVFQFMQVPHKAMMTWTFNRAMNPVDKAKLLVFNTAMYSLPPAAMYNWFGEGGLNVLPESPEARDAVVQGLESYMLNKLLTMATGEKTSIDFSGLSPFDVHGMMEFMVGLWTTSPIEMFKASPSGSLMFGGNPRITDAARSWASMFSYNDDGELMATDPDAWMHTLKTTLAMTSGFSNAFKAQFALETHKKMSAAGNITDGHVTQVEAYLTAFGFPTMDETNARWINNELYRKSEDLRNDVKKYVSQLSRELARDGISKDEQQFAIQAINKAWKQFGDDNMEARKIVKQELTKMIANKNGVMFKRAMEMANWKDSAGVRDMIMNLPDVPPEQKQRLMELLDYIDSYKGE